MRAGGLHGIALCLALLAAAARGQFLANPAAFNPLAGQGVPPDGIPASEFPVDVLLEFQRLLAIDAASYTFTLAFYWAIGWEDERALGQIMEPYQACKFLCLGLPDIIINSAGQPACCDNVFVPQAEVITVAGFDSQTIPFYHYLQPSRADPNRMFYLAYMQGEFSAALNFDAYPFDKHYLCLDIQTSFFPKFGNRVALLNQSLSGGAVGAVAGYLLDSQKPETAGKVYKPGSPRPPVRNPNVRFPANACLFTPYSGS